MSMVHFGRVRVHKDFHSCYQQNDDDDDDNALAEFADLQGGKDNKVAAVKVSSLRTDLLIKSGMGLARKYAHSHERAD